MSLTIQDKLYFATSNAVCFGYNYPCSLSAMNTVGQRLKYARELAGLTQAELAKAAGVTQQSIQQLEQGLHKSSRALVHMAEALSVRPAWLAKGQGEMRASTARGPDVTGSVPLISWVAAGRWSEIVDEYPLGEGEKPVYTTKDVGPNAFALRVRGDSMENPRGKPTYPEGSIIIVDPAKVPKSGDRVVVRLEETQEATFKVYREDAGKKWLFALNPQYMPIEINGNATICGVVVQTIIDED
jgi:SOS-response transcriptional repressor LexA